MSSRDEIENRTYFCFQERKRLAKQEETNKKKIKKEKEGSGEALLFKFPSQAVPLITYL